MNAKEDAATRKMKRRAAIGSADADDLEEAVTIDLVNKIIDLGGYKTTPGAFMTMWRSLPIHHLARQLHRIPLGYGKNDCYVQDVEWTFRNGWMTSNVYCERCDGDGLQRQVSFGRASASKGFYATETTTSYWVCTCGAFRDILLNL